METILGTFKIIIEFTLPTEMLPMCITCSTLLCHIAEYWQWGKELFLTSQLKLESKFIFKTYEVDQYNKIRVRRSGISHSKMTVYNDISLYFQNMGV